MHDSYCSVNIYASPRSTFTSENSWLMIHSSHADCQDVLIWNFFNNYFFSILHDVLGLIACKQ